MTCKNCQAPAPGAYCAACGQQTHIHRVTMGHLGHELTHALTHADKGFFLLIKELITRPGIVAREYLDGKRKKYFNPLTFLVLTSAFIAYAGYASGYFAAITHASQASTNRYRQEVTDIVVNNGKLLALILMVPLLAMLSWLISIRSRFNLAENFVLHAFVMGQFNVVRLLIFIPAFLIAPATSDWNVFIHETFFFIYLVVAYHQFFQNKWIFAILKAIVVYFMFVTLYWILIFAFVLARDFITG